MLGNYLFQFRIFCSSTVGPLLTSVSTAVLHHQVEYYLFKACLIPGAKSWSKGTLLRESGLNAANLSYLSTFYQVTSLGIS